MSLKKQVLKSKPITKVTFRVSKEMAEGAESVTVVGDFNDWDQIATPLSQLKNGEYTVTIPLDQGKAYAFKYLVDGTDWYIEPDADAQVPNGLGGENSLVEV